MGHSHTPLHSFTSKGTEMEMKRSNSKPEGTDEKNKRGITGFWGIVQNILNKLKHSYHVSVLFI